MYQLILKVFEFTKDFPREYKYTLGQDMKRDAIVLVRSIYRANKVKNKTEYLEQFLDDFEILKLEIRLCVDLKIMSFKKQSEIALLMEGKGKHLLQMRLSNLLVYNNIREVKTVNPKARIDYRYQLSSLFLPSSQPNPGPAPCLPGPLLLEPLVLQMHPENPLRIGTLRIALAPGKILPVQIRTGHPEIPA